MTRQIAILICFMASVFLPSVGGAPLLLAQAGPAKSSISKQEKQAATPIELAPSPKSLLPDDFDGWTVAEPIKALTDPAEADPANAAARRRRMAGRRMP